MFLIKNVLKLKGEFSDKKGIGLKVILKKIYHFTSQIYRNRFHKTPSGRAIQHFYKSLALNSENHRHSWR